MTDRPMLFSAPMVQALIREAKAPGTGKTQTRRTLAIESSVCRESAWKAVRGADGVWRLLADTPDVIGKVTPSLRIAVGDRLYVRETWSHTGTGVWTVSDTHRALDGKVVYEADGRLPGAKYWPSIHMPRWASRITLTVTDVRVQRLQEISEADAIAEGFPNRWALDRRGTPGAPLVELNPIRWYRDLWDSLNGAGAWASNPWVAAYTFTVALGNIDQIARAS